MSALLLVPYNDSMRLGQGYNSFLQNPCLANAVTVSEASLKSSHRSGRQDGTSQTVAYSASFVDKMSELVQSMNISAGSSIRTGSVNTSAGSSTIDEAKFSESDLNAVLYVKVINQTRTVVDQVVFNPVNMANMNSDAFHSLYGDTFVSGFLEGGDLYGIISVKILEASRKQDIRKRLKSQLNGPNSEWSPSSAGQLADVMSSIQTTITVNYSGGGIIKDVSQEWTLESLMAVASSFPDKVAVCPQRTSAILSRYNTIPSFVEWMSQLSQPITIRQYEGVQRYTSELLDTFMEYKANLVIVNDAMRHLQLYDQSSAEDAVALNLKALVSERKKIKSEMEKMAQRIERLDKDPEAIAELVAQDDILAPELHRARLPMKRDLNAEKAAQDAVKSLLEGLNLSGDPAGHGKPGGVNNLDDKTELMSLRQQVGDLQQLLKQAQEGLKIKEGELLASESSLRTASEQVTRHSETVNQQKKQITETEERFTKQIEKLKSEHAEKLRLTESDLANWKTEHGKMKGERDGFENQARITEKARAAMETQRDDIKRQWDSIPEYQVTSIMITRLGQPVGDYLLEKDASGTDIKAHVMWRIQNKHHDKLNPATFGNYDPFPGFAKWFRVIYYKKGEQKRIEGPEGTEVTWG